MEQKHKCYSYDFFASVLKCRYVTFKIIFLILLGLRKVVRACLFEFLVFFMKSFLTKGSYQSFAVDTKGLSVNDFVALGRDLKPML